MKDLYYLTLNVFLKKIFFSYYFNKILSIEFIELIELINVYKMLVCYT